MRIVLDLQGCQSESRNRGIGRYSIELALALVRHCNEHEYWPILNGTLPTINLRDKFSQYLPAEHIKIFDIPKPANQNEENNAWRGRAGELLRENFIESIKPDFVHISSLFEGFLDNSVLSIPKNNEIPTAVTLYDLIPLVTPDILNHAPHYKKWYENKIGHILRADKLLSISEYSRQEAINKLGISPDKIVTISAGVDEKFRKIPISQIDENNIRRRYGLSKPFLICNMSDFSPRKNLSGLIEAVAQLSEKIKTDYQLAIVGNNQSEYENIKNAVNLSKKLGVNSEFIIFTDHVPDDDLIRLYNLCYLFIIPSLQEGFGLPAVEAMSCGAPVIGANATSLPEVIGCKDALFNPLKADSIAKKIAEVIDNKEFYNKLKKHSLLQAKKFTWYNCAKLASSMFSQNIDKKIYVSTKPRPHLAFISPLPPEPSGISSYSEELIIYLNDYYHIDLISNNSNDVKISKLLDNKILSVDRFKETVHKYDRVIYQLGNSPFHSHMFELLNETPGVVVLHDFYLSAVLEYMERISPSNYNFRRELHYSHGYQALKIAEEDTKEAIKLFPCNKKIFNRADGVIIHSPLLKEMSKEWYKTDNNFCVIPQLRSIPKSNDRRQARKYLGLGEDDLLIASFGHLADTKLNDRLLSVWLNSSFAQQKHYKLAFVGEASGLYGENLIKTIRSSGFSENITITGFQSKELYECYLKAADVAVQLRTAHRGETSRAVLDCLAYGLPTIINAHGTMRDISESVAIVLADKFHNEDLENVLSSLLANKQLRHNLGIKASEYIRNNHDPKNVASQYYQAIEEFSKKGKRSKRTKLLTKISQINSKFIREDLTSVSRKISFNENSFSNEQFKIFVDVSAIRNEDKHTGIERVVRAIINNLIELEKYEFRIEPVYFCQKVNNFRYARKYYSKTYAGSRSFLDDVLIEFDSGDYFLGLDWSLPTVLSGQEALRAMRNRGVRIVFTIYDLLPILHPRFFPDWLEKQFAEWLAKVVAIADGVMCISQSVAHELNEWLDKKTIQSELPTFNIGYFHLGCDLERSVPTIGISQKSLQLMENAKRHPFLLMVGTIEPRKGHMQSIKAFELLWKNEINVGLVIVGRGGWMVDAIIERLRSHPESGKQLFWFEQASDELLSDLYQSADGLIAASEGEGFGLPIIEAAHYSLPVIARDLPVFREIGGNNISYFSGTTALELADAISDWLRLQQEAQVPSSKGIKRISWLDSAEQLLHQITKDKWYIEAQL